MVKAKHPLIHLAKSKSLECRHLPFTFTALYSQCTEIGTSAGRGELFHPKIDGYK